MLCIFGAAFWPFEDAYAVAAGEKQSSFEYKQYKDQNQYRNALDQKMPRVCSAIGDAIDDKGDGSAPDNDTADESSETADGGEQGLEEGTGQ